VSCGSTTRTRACSSIPGCGPGTTTRACLGLSPPTNESARVGCRARGRPTRAVFRRRTGTNLGVGVGTNPGRGRGRVIGGRKGRGGRLLAGRTSGRGRSRGQRVGRSKGGRTGAKRGDRSGGGPDAISSLARPVPTAAQSARSGASSDVVRTCAHERENGRGARVLPRRREIGHAKAARRPFLQCWI
jgi:hypothetical protein